MRPRLLSEGITLLRDLARRGDDAPTARSRVTDWRARHPGLRADLLIHKPPATHGTRSRPVAGSFRSCKADTVRALLVPRSR